MNVKCLCFLTCFVCVLHVNVTIAQLLAHGTQSITIGDGEKLFLFWRPTTKSLVQCSVTTPSKKNINLFQGSQGSFIVSSNYKFQDGYCSVIVNKMAYNRTNGTYILDASDGANNFSTSFSVDVKAPVVVINSTVNVVEGSSTTLSCGDQSATYCKITDPKGKVQTFGGPCQVRIFGATFYDHHGFWNCTFYVIPYTTEFSSNIEVKIVRENKKEIFMEEFANEVVFYCVCPEPTCFAKLCKITTPYGKDLFLKSGRAYGRYTYFGKNNKTCGVTIPKPLASEDIGPWKCQIINSLNGWTPNVYGGYLSVGTDNKLKGLQIPKKKMFLSPSTYMETMLCHVPYIIEYCWFRSPNGTVYNIKDKFYAPSNQIVSEGFKFGDCSMNMDDLAKAELKNNTGQWTCHVGIVKESVIELKGKITLLYSDTPIIQNEKEISGELESSVELGCRTGSGIGIKYCRLVRPDGTGLSVNPVKNNSDYSYNGKGFLYGECGVTINSLKTEDIGKWMCTTKLISATDEEYSTYIIVKKEKGSFIAVYITVGVVCLLSILGISYFIARKFEFTIHRRFNDDTVNLIARDTTEEESTRDYVINTEPVHHVRRRSPRPPTITTQLPTPGTTYI